MANPASAFPSAPPIFVDRGSGAKLLQPANQSTYVANVVTTASALTSYGFTQAQADSIPAAINSILAALISAGIMKSS